MTDPTIKHQWEQREEGVLKGHWICEHCRKCSRTMRKPPDEGCTREIEKWVIETDGDFEELK